MTLLIVCLLLLAPQAPAKKPAAPPAAAAPFVSHLSLEQMKGKQAVIETTAGTIVLDLLPEAAPNHVAYFIKLATDGTFNGTTFHRAIKYGIVQGGDPLSKDPAKRDLYGTGGLGVLKAEPNPEKHTRGAVSGVILPGKPDSGGAQFFICIVDQPALDGQYTVFARVARGIAVASKISEAAVDEKGKVIDRVEIRSVTLRDRVPDETESFTRETPSELAAYRAVIETTLGAITVEFRPDKAPEHVRNFLRLAAAGVYDGMAFHRVVRGFVVQTGSLNYRKEPLDEVQQKLVRTLQPEFNTILHEKGTLSMARGDDPASASTSFFICTASASGLDGKYTAFGRVVDGLSVVEAIEALPVDGEMPKEKVNVVRVRVEKK